MMTVEHAIKRNKFLTCVICGKKYLNRYWDYEIRVSGKGKVCSQKCANLLKFKNRKGGYITCPVCGKVTYYTPTQFVKSKGRMCKTCWTKERRISNDGYWLIHTPEGLKREQRYLMEQKLGRKLTINEVVHHINENKLDNRMENLLLLTRAEHVNLHRK